MKLSWASLPSLDLASVLILTPNQRLSRFLLEAWLRETKHTSNAVAGDRILALDSWMQQSFLSLQFQLPEHFANTRLLDKQEESSIWQQILRASEKAEELWFTGAAKLAMEAQTYIDLWHIDPKTIEKNHYCSEDHSSFLQWRQAFEQYCSRKNLLTQAQLYDILIAAIKEKRLPLPADIYFYGFDEYHPSQQALVSALEKECQITHILVGGQQASEQSLVACAEFESEIELAAQWAKSIVDKQNSARVAIVVPSLNQERSIIDRIFTGNFCTEQLRLDQQDKVKNYNISSGSPLSKSPLVNSALLCLQLFFDLKRDNLLSSNSLKALLDSPFVLNGLLGFHQRQSLKLALGKSRKMQVKIGELLRIINKNEGCEALSTHIRQLAATLGGVESNMSYSGWARLFKQQLETIGWLIDIELNSENFQLLNKFRQQLEQFARLDRCLDPCSYAIAFNTLQDILNNTLFQVESIDEQRNQVNILGVLEAAGQDFTHIWLCQTDSEKWPASAKPNPFLPQTLQNDHQLPHASAERELDFSTRIMKRLLHHSEHFIASYSQRSGDQELKASQLVRNLPAFDEDTFRKHHAIDREGHIEEHILHHGALEVFHDNKLLPVEETANIKGGQAILGNHARCPFASFAANRLKLTQPDEIKLSIDAMDRGQILHRFMELFWRKIENQQNLLKLDQRETDKLLDGIAEQIYQDFQKDLEEHRKALSIECQRAIIISKHLIEIEKKREDFRVLATEEKQSVTLGPLTIHIRIDRIDQVGDKGKLIIDYKSSSQKISNWLTPKMDEPQLPLYLFNNKDTCGISYITLSRNKNDTGYTGLAETASIAPGILACNDDKAAARAFKENWHDNINDWKNDLLSISSDFAKGNTRIDPKNLKTSCQYCDYSSMCRINELTATQYDDE